MLFCGILEVEPDLMNFIRMIFLSFFPFIQMQNDLNARVRHKKNTNFSLELLMPRFLKDLEREKAFMMNSIETIYW